MANSATEPTFSHKTSRVFIALPSVAALLLLCLFVLPFAQAQGFDPAKAEISQYLEGNDVEAIDEGGYEVFSLTGQDNVDAQTNQSDTQGSIVIPNYIVPLTETHQNSMISGNGGSFVNTAIGIICICAMGIMLLVLLARKTTDYRVIVVRTIAVTFGLVTVVIWSLFDRIQVPSVMINDSTTMVIACFSVFVIMAAISYAYESRLEKKRATRRNNRV